MKTMEAKEYENWLNSRMDFYAQKAEEAENEGNLDEMNKYGYMFDATRDAYYIFTGTIKKVGER